MRRTLVLFPVMLVVLRNPSIRAADLNKITNSTLQRRKSPVGLIGSFGGSYRRACRLITGLDALSRVERGGGNVYGIHQSFTIVKLNENTTTGYGQSVSVTHIANMNKKTET